MKRSSFTNRFLLILFISLFSFTTLKVAYADENEACYQQWLKKGENITDQAIYNDVGKEFCSCLTSKFDDEDKPDPKAVSAASTECLLTSVSHKTVSVLEENKKPLNADNFPNECLTVYHGISKKDYDKDDKLIASYCGCVSQKVAKLSADDSIEDDEFDQHVNAFSKECLTANFQAAK